jgi:anaerobic magnesium-protoporphyrin IX monomethyl ester cyclase
MIPSQHINACDDLVLYQPRCDFYTMPLSLLAVGSAVGDLGVRPVIVDGRLEDDPISAVLARIDRAVAVGITVLTGAPIIDAIAVSRAVKKQRPGCPVIWGGWHSSLFPEQILAEAECVDFVVRGQGEPVARDLVAMLQGGGDPSTVPGLTFRMDGRIVSNPARPLTPMADLPRANYDTIDVERYFQLKRQRQLDFVTSVGCHYRCRFCADPTVFLRRRTALRADESAEHLVELAARFDVGDVNFQDETFFTDRRWCLDLAERLASVGRRFSWAATMRADQGCRMNDTDFSVFRSSGLRKLLIGVESGSPRILERLGKDITREQVLEVADRCRDHGIAVTYPFIFGIPGEETADIHASLELAVHLRALDPRNDTPFFFYKPYPGSDLAHDVEALGGRVPKNLEEWAQFDYVNTDSPLG